MRRTLVVTNDFPPRRGGIENFVLGVCAALPPDQVVVYTSRTNGAEAFDASLGFPVTRDRSRVLLPTPRVAREVSALARQHGCDRVIFGAAAPLGLLAGVLRREAGVRHVTAMTHGHEVWWSRVPGARALLRRIGDGADVVTYVSEFCRGEIARALSPPARSRMRRLSPAVDRERFHPGLDGSAWRDRLGLPGDVPVALCAARLVRRKGQDTLIRAWPEVLGRCPEARLVIMGDGPARRRLARMVRARDLKERVRLVPGVPWQQMPSVYAMADVFVMPCRTRLWGLEPEAFGMVFQEAAACGLPVIAGDSGGAAEAVEAVGGFVVEPRSVRAVADAVAGQLGRVSRRKRA